MASWTWSHSIDDSTDLQTLQEPQDNKNPRLDRSNSNFDQRHRFVVSGVFDSPWKSTALLKNWTFSPTIEASSGRPYSLLTLNDSTLINSGSTARPSVVQIGTPGSFASPDDKVGLIQPTFVLGWQSRQKRLPDEQFFFGRFSSHPADCSGRKTPARVESGCVQPFQSRQYPRSRQLLHAGRASGGRFRSTTIAVQRKTSVLDAPVHSTEDRGWKIEDCDLLSFIFYPPSSILTKFPLQLCEFGL